MRPFPAKSRFFTLILLLVFLVSSAPSLAVSKTPYSGVSPLKAGHSNRIEAANNPVNYVDPLGLEPCDPEEQYDRVRLLREAWNGTFNWDNAAKLGISIL